jgi:hypothetical protein
MDTPTLKQILIEEMENYTGEGLNVHAYLTRNDVEQLYTVVDIAVVRGKRLVGIALFARIVDRHIIIELDHNDKMLVDALKARGVPSEQVVLAYAGEGVAR